MDNEVMLDASEWEGFRRLRKVGWRVSVSERLWERYVRVPEQADEECEKERHRKLLANLLSALRGVGRREAGPFSGFGFRMDALLNDPQMDGDVMVATVEIGVFPTFDRRRLPRLLVCLMKETIPARPGRSTSLH